MTGRSAGLSREEPPAPCRLSAAPFAATLRHWGLRGEDLPKALAFWRLEALAGFGLSAFALASLAAGLWSGRHPGDAPGADWSMAGALARHLAHLAAASMALAGLALCLAACWRRAVIRGRRFVSFAEWLCFWR